MHMLKSGIKVAGTSFRTWQEGPSVRATAFQRATFEEVGKNKAKLIWRHRAFFVVAKKDLFDPF